MIAAGHGEIQYRERDRSLHQEGDGEEICPRVLALHRRQKFRQLCDAWHEKFYLFLHGSHGYFTLQIWRINVPVHQIYLVIYSELILLLVSQWRLKDILVGWLWKGLHPCYRKKTSRALCKLQLIFGFIGDSESFALSSEPKPMFLSAPNAYWYLDSNIIVAVEWPTLHIITLCEMVSWNGSLSLR